MSESLRARLLTWHSAILVTVVALFAVSVSYLGWRARLAEIDVSLQAVADEIGAAIEPVDGGAFDLSVAPRLWSGSTTLYYSVWTKEGTLIDRSDAERTVPPPGEPGVRTREGGRELTTIAPAGVRVVVGRDLGDVRREVWSLAATLSAVGAAVLALSVAAGWLLIGRALAPLTRINATARRMTEGELDARIPIERVETELGQVARALNDAFDRLRASLERQRRFTADASHELRTPLTTMSTEVQWALARERSADAYRESLEVCRRAAGRMQTTVERLLALARADARTPQPRTTDIRLDALVAAVASDLAPLAASRAIRVKTDVIPVTVPGQPDDLREAITNVFANAVRYNVDGGAITVRLEEERGQARLTISDTGVGIDAKDLPFIFDAFFRADVARTRDSGGAGLGLAVTRAVVEQHQGTVRCASERGVGTTITVVLPEARWATEPDRSTPAPLRADDRVLQPHPPG